MLSHSLTNTHIHYVTLWNTLLKKAQETSIWVTNHATQQTSKRTNEQSKKQSKQTTHQQIHYITLWLEIKNRIHTHGFGFKAEFKQLSS